MRASVAGGHHASIAQRQGERGEIARSCQQSAGSPLGRKIRAADVDESRCGETKCGAESRSAAEFGRVVVIAGGNPRRVDGLETFEPNIGQSKRFEKIPMQQIDDVAAGDFFDHQAEERVVGCWRRA